VGPDLHVGGRADPDAGALPPKSSGRCVFSSVKSRTQIRGLSGPPHIPAIHPSCSKIQHNKRKPDLIDPRLKNLVKFVKNQENLTETHGR
jgi:hypothetical protein